MKQLLIFLFLLPLMVNAQAPVNWKPNKYNLKPNVIPKPVPVPKPTAAQARAMAAPSGDTLWNLPLMITKGGHYGGYFKSTDATPVIQINTTERVYLHDFVLDAAGEVSIMGYGGTNIEIYDGVINTHPLPDKQHAKINIWGAKYVYIHNVKLNHTGGILIEKWQGTGDSALIIRNNIILDTDKRRGNGTKGDHRAGVQFSTIVGLKNAEVSGNILINLPGQSLIEDNFNFYNTSGTKEKPIRIFNNYIQGSHPIPVTDPHTGSGVTFDGTPGSNAAGTMSGYFECFNNTVTDCQNALMNIAAGRSVHCYNNRLVCASLLPSGQSAPGYWGGCCIWDASNEGAAFTDNYIRNNILGYVRNNFNVPFANRQDYVVVSGNPEQSIKPTDNTHLPNPITKAQEQAEYGIYLARVGSGETPIIIDTTVSKTAVRVDSTVTVIISPVDGSGKIVGYKTGSVSVTTSNGLLMTKTGDEKQFTLKGVTAGTGNYTVSVTSLTGKIVTRTFSITVLPPLEDIQDIRVRVL